MAARPLILLSQGYTVPVSKRKLKAIILLYVGLGLPLRRHESEVHAHTVHENQVGRFSRSEARGIPPSLPLPPSLSHCYCIDHNNVSGGTPFHGHSSETELHKPFTTRSPWWMAGPPAKAPRPDRFAFLHDKCQRKDVWHLPISHSLKWERVCYRRDKKTHGAVLCTITQLYMHGGRGSSTLGILATASLLFSYYSLAVKSVGD